MKNTQNHVNCEVKPNFGKKQLEAKCSPIAFYIGFSQSSHTLHVLYQKMCFSVESNKTLQKCNQTPFFCSNRPFKRSTPEAHFLSFFGPGHKHLRKLYKHLGKVPKTSCTCRFSCAFLSCPPSPFTQVEGGNA